VSAFTPEHIPLPHDDYEVFKNSNNTTVEAYRPIDSCCRQAAKIEMLHIVKNSAKSLKVVQGHSKLQRSVGRVKGLIS